jgi:peroxiredoxin
MKARYTVVPIIAALILAFFATSAFAVGEAASDFSLKTTKGADFRLGDVLGKKVIVMSFWMSWCKPCLVEMPQLEKLYKKYKDKGMTVVSINADDPSGAVQAKNIVRQKRVTYPVLMDSDTKVTSLYNPSKQFPQTILIDMDGKIAYVKTGFSAGDQKVLEEKILSLLSAKE